LLIQRLQNFWRVYRKNKAAVAGLFLVVGFLVIGTLANYIAPFNPFKLVGGPLEAPSWRFLMGTDELGRDIFSETVFGLWTSLLVGLLAATTSTLVGVLVGALTGYFVGRIDSALMRVTELFQIIPQLFLALAAVAILGSTFWNIIWVLGLTSWPATARLVRAEFLSLRERPFVEAVRGLGAGDSRLVFSEILPNADVPVIVNASFVAASAIIIEAGLAYLGAGDPNVPSLGTILSSAVPYLATSWWLSLFPGLLIALTVLSLNLVGDGLNEALNPKLRER